MREFVIEFNQVWKRYSLEKDRPGFKEFMVNLHKFVRTRGEGNTDFYALKNVNLKIKRGECIGIIGRNGAGKSTLLSLMLGTTLPSKGKVTILDRVTPLLELGGGFHFDLTGRENIVLNGILLGFTKAEILHKMSSIIAFSEIEDFIDFPVRTYSSGMFLRLAFSVAIHTDPRILIIDEVLSVGDEGFQEKSQEAMLSLIRSGATAVFVSHNLQAIEAICDRVIWLDHGEVMAEGETEEVTERYHREIMHIG
jgi:lipopolysaccharide transport system ATP-binding protein